MARRSHLNGPARAHAHLQPVPFRVERFEYAPADLLLRLSVRISLELPDPARAVLFIEREAIEHVYAPLLACTGRPQLDRTGETLWRGAFAVPPDLACDPGALFAVRLSDAVLLALPAPGGRVVALQEPSEPDWSGRTWPHALRRSALLLVVTGQLCLAPGWSSTALANSSRGAMTNAETPPETPPAEGSGEPAPETPPAPPGGGSGEPAPETPPAPPKPAPETPSTTPTSAPGASVTPSSTQAPLTTSPPAGEGSPGPRVKSAPATPSKGHGSASHNPHKRHAQARPRRPGLHAPSKPRVPSTTSVVPGLSEIPPLLSGLQGALEDNPPAYLIPIYKQAGRRYHVPWQVLAAINQIETDYGRNLAVSSSGAVGWMQFMPETWRQWAVDADHDGQLNPYSPQDAIFTAARYLQASGASHDLTGAIFAYNHANWYVAEVLFRARMLRDTATFARIEKGYSLPLDARYMQQLGRTDDGVDIETAPDGAIVYSITAGIVSAVASDPAGFGPNYPVIAVAGGSLAGQHIYYGHVAQALVQPGQRVAAGQPIAIIGHTGDAISLGHGHIEIGFSDASGDPLSHHAATAATPAGDVMRSFLVTLSAAFGVHNS
jgi:murein DD-endopeptidase MepM/ murein hydrolase activator NlpD